MMVMAYLERCSLSVDSKTKEKNAGGILEMKALNFRNKITEY
jgi:hypothetical protein